VGRDGKGERRLKNRSRKRGNDEGVIYSFDLDAVPFAFALRGLSPSLCSSSYRMGYWKCGESCNFNFTL
jgi:hypothetical protein